MSTGIAVQGMVGTDEMTSFRLSPSGLDLRVTLACCVLAQLAAIYTGRVAPKGYLKQSVLPLLDTQT